MNEIPAMSIIYKDSLIEITGQEIVFYNYYYPSCRAKRVLLNDIDWVNIKQPSFWGGSWRLWGTGDLRTWFPKDYKRPKRDRIFIAFLRNKCRRIGFTVEDSEKVIGILKIRGLLRETP